MISSYCKMSPYVFYPFRAELTIVCDNFQHKISFLGKNQDLFYFASTLNQLNSPNDKIAPNIEVFTETWNSGELPVWANDPSQIPGSLGKPPDLDIILQDFRAESLDILKEWDSLDEGNSRACSGQDCQDRSFETDQSVIERLRSAGVYDQLIFENFRLQDDFERITDLFSKLQGKWRKALSYDIFVAFRIFTLCLIAFLLPFRVGKSLHDLNR